MDVRGLFFALKWFGHMANGTISYNGRTSAVVVPALSGLVLLGAVCRQMLLSLCQPAATEQTSSCSRPFG